MANRRMFSLDVVNTDKFLDMPATTQLLYFHLGMNADDDGFVASPKRLAKMLGCGEDDLKLLLAKEYLIAFDNGIVVITDWNINNWIRPDRKHDTRFVKEKEFLDISKDRYIITTECLPCDNQMATECHTEDRLGKVSIGKVNNINQSEIGMYIDYQQITDLYNNICVSFPKVTRLSETRKKAIKARLKVYTVEDFKKLFELAESSSFLKGQNNRNWSATFDWLIKDTNMAKVLDGNYADNSSSYRNAVQQFQKESDGYEMYREMYRKLPSSPDDPFQ